MSPLPPLEPNVSREEKRREKYIEDITKQQTTHHHIMIFYYYYYTYTTTYHYYYYCNNIYNTSTVLQVACIDLTHATQTGVNSHAPSAILPQYIALDQGSMSSFAARHKGKKLGLTLMSFGPSSEEADLAANLAAHGELNVKSNRDNIKEVIKEHSAHGLTTEDIIKEAEKEGPYDIQSDLVFLHKLGHGTSGTVSLYLYVPTLKLVAVKEMDISSEQHRVMYEHELHAVHDNIMPLDIASGVERTRNMLSSKNLLHDVLENDQKLHQTMQDSTSDTTTSAPIRRRNSIARNSRAGKRLRTLISFHRKPSLNIVSFYGAYVKQEMLIAALVMEYMDCGSLKGIVDNGGIQSENVLRHIARSSLKGLATMHRKKTLHRDIKPDNILINSAGDAKIADFGLASHVENKDDGLKAFEGTLAYMSPERMKGEVYSYASDIWSIGMTILALALGASPSVFLLNNDVNAEEVSTLRGEANLSVNNGNANGVTNEGPGIRRQRSKSNFFDLMSAVSQPLPRSLLVELNEGTVVRRDGINYVVDLDSSGAHNGFSKDMVDFIFIMLDVDPSKRSTASELLNHNFLQVGTTYNKDGSSHYMNDWSRYAKSVSPSRQFETLETILENIKVHCGAGAIFSENAVNHLARSLNLTEDETYNEFIAAGLKIESL